MLIWASIICITLSGQTKFDKVFLDDASLVIGTIINVDDKYVTISDVESGRELTLLRSQVGKIIYRDGSVEEYESTKATLYRFTPDSLFIADSLYQVVEPTLVNSVGSMMGLIGISLAIFLTIVRN